MQNEDNFPSKLSGILNFHLKLTDSWQYKEAKVKPASKNI